MCVYLVYVYQANIHIPSMHINAYTNTLQPKGKTKGKRENLHKQPSTSTYTAYSTGWQCAAGDQDFRRRRQCRGWHWLWRQEEGLWLGAVARTSFFSFLFFQSLSVCVCVCGWFTEGSGGHTIMEDNDNVNQGIGNM